MTAIVAVTEHEFATRTTCSCCFPPATSIVFARGDELDTSVLHQSPQSIQELKEMRSTELLPYLRNDGFQTVYSTLRAPVNPYELKVVRSACAALPIVSCLRSPRVEVSARFQALCARFEIIELRGCV